MDTLEETFNKFDEIIAQFDKDIEAIKINLKKAKKALEIDDQTMSLCRYSTFIYSFQLSGGIVFYRLYPFIFMLYDQ